MFLLPNDDFLKQDLFEKPSYTHKERERQRDLSAGSHVKWLHWSGLDQTKASLPLSTGAQAVKPSSAAFPGA